MRKIMMVYTLVGFLISLIAHALTYWYISISNMTLIIWLLHIGAFIAVISMYALPANTENKVKSKLGLYDGFPDWVQLVILAFSIYIVINFGLFVVNSSNGFPKEKNGKYIIYENKGKTFRELSQQEYAVYELHRVRGVSGHLILFYLIPTFHFLYSKKR